MSGPRVAATGRVETRPPVVVSFDAHGVLLDVVGDIDRFLAVDETREQLFQRLHDLRQGQAGAPVQIPAVELALGRYADIHVLGEDDAYHFVIQDNTELMQTLRQSQQAGNEAALAEARQRRALHPPERPAPLHGTQLHPFRRSSDLLGALVSEARGPVLQVAAHARVLGTRFRDDAGVSRSIAAIQQAAVRLQALADNGLAAFAGSNPAMQHPERIDLVRVAALLEDTFALQARGWGVEFQVQVAAGAGLIELDPQRLRQILINLLIHALEGKRGGRVVVSLLATTQGLEIAIEGEPDGFPAAQFGALVTSDNLLLSNVGGNLGLAVSQQLLRQMGAAVELVPRQFGGYELWMRLPLAPAAGADRGVASPQPERLLPALGGPGERVVVIAVEPATTALDIATLLAQLDIATVSVRQSQAIVALIRNGAVGGLVLSSGFDGVHGDALLPHLGLPADARLLLLTEPAVGPAATGPRGAGVGMQVPADADHQHLHAALRTVFADWQ